MSTDKVFNHYSQYYDLLYRDKDYFGEVCYIQNILNRYGIQETSKLLEFGSGTGKHGSLLANQGYHVTGIENSAKMVSQAMLANNFTCQQGDIRKIHLNRKFDVIISLFHVISYQVANSDVYSVFNRAAEHLNTAGLFLFDFWYTPAVISQRPDVRIKRLIDGKKEITRIAEPVVRVNENRVDVNYTIFVNDSGSGIMQTLQEIHSMRHFSLPEIDLLADKFGFERVLAEEFLTGNELSEDTWSACVLLQKNMNAYISK